MPEITRYRGDTIPDKVVVKDTDGNVVNIAGYTFLLTVASEKEPADDTTEEFQVVGSITDAANGVVEFAPTALQTDITPGVYYYDVQMTTPAGRIGTILKDKYTILQDITK